MVLIESNIKIIHECRVQKDEGFVNETSNELIAVPYAVFKTG